MGLCRVCGCNRNLKNIIYPGNNELLLMLKLCANIKIDFTDNLPKNLCYECENGLQFAFRLRKRSEKTNILLQQGLLTSNQTSEGDSQQYFVKECFKNEDEDEDDKHMVVEFTDKVANDTVDESIIENHDNVSELRTIIDVETGNLYESCLYQQNKETINICIECNEAFPSLFALNSHYKTHQFDTNQEDQSEEGLNFKNNLDKWKSLTIFEEHKEKCCYKCIVCDYISISRSQHIKHCVRHTHGESVQYNEIEDTLEYFLKDESDLEIIQDTESIQNESINIDANFTINNDDDEEDQVYEIQENDIDVEFETQTTEHLKKKTNGFVCEICNEVCARAHVLAAHIQIHQVDNVLKKHLRSNNDIKHDIVSKYANENWKSITTLQRIKSKLYYKCEVCLKYTKCRSQHIKHCGKHTGENHSEKYIRTINGFQINDQTKNKEKRFKCDQCFSSFINKTTLSIHKRSNHPMLKRKCNYSPQGFNNHSSFESHQHSQTDKLQFECNFCDKIFKGKRDKTNHEIKMHSIESEGNCRKNDLKDTSENDGKEIEVTRKSVSTALALKKNSKYCCEFCGKIYSKKNEFYLHKATHQEKKFKCSNCNLKFRYKYALTMHIRIHTGEKPYKCNFCDLKFAKLETLKIHLVEHVACEAISNDNDPIILNKSKCNLFENSDDKQLKCLANEKEIIDASKPHTCQICLKQYLRYKFYLKHMSNHDKKAFECKICGANFKYPTHYKQHMYIHSGQRPHICHICNKGFRSPWNLKVHLRMHSGTKPVKCEICGKHFSRMQSLRLHKYQHIKQLVIDPMQESNELPLNVSTSSAIENSKEHFFEQDKSNEIKKRKYELKLKSVQENYSLSNVSYKVPNEQIVSLKAKSNVNDKDLALLEEEECIKAIEISVNRRGRPQKKNLK